MWPEQTPALSKDNEDVSAALVLLICLLTGIRPRLRNDGKKDPPLLGTGLPSRLGALTLYFVTEQCERAIRRCSPHLTSR